MMRVSAIKEDQCYVSNRSGIEVTLDGIPVRDCIVADESEAYIITSARDSNGRLIGDGKQLSTLKRHGRVVISLSRERNVAIGGSDGLVL
jgi:hypothetical protein